MGFYKSHPYVWSAIFGEVTKEKASALFRIVPDPE